jgi:hypothetical protein
MEHQLARTGGWARREKRPPGPSAVSTVRSIECAMCDFDVPMLPADLKNFRLSGGPI